MRGSGEEMVGGTRVRRRIWGWVLALRVVLGKSFPFQRQCLPSPEEIRVPSPGTPRTQGSKSGWRESWPGLAVSSLWMTLQQEGEGVEFQRLKRYLCLLGKLGSLSTAPCWAQDMAIQ